jgi:hypothetical protein
MSAKSIHLAILLLGLCGRPTSAADHDVVWGAPQAGVRIGVQRAASTGSTNGVIIIYVARSTNYMRDLVIPADAFQSFDYSLRWTNAQLVKPTTTGRRYGASLDTEMPRWRRINNELQNLGDEPQQMAWFRLDECFTVTQTGEYELEIRPRLLRENGKKRVIIPSPFKGEDVILVPVLFDPIRLRLHLEANSQLHTEKPGPGGSQ